MIHDILDIMNPRQRFTLTGRYYSEPLNGPDVGAQQFNYEYVNPYSKTWRNLFANIQVNDGRTAIRTNDQLSFKSGSGIVILQDGTAYLIEEKMKDYQAAEKEAFRILPVPVSTQYVLRLVETANPWCVQ